MRPPKKQPAPLAPSTKISPTTGCQHFTTAVPMESLPALTSMVVQSITSKHNSKKTARAAMLITYRQRVTAGSTYKGVNGDKKRRAFPPGLRFTAGNPTRRTFDPAVSAHKAISHVCLGSNYPEGPPLPPVNCPNGVRSQIYFPSCWDGVNLDSANHQDHMSYPLGNRPDSGVCPDSHPVPMISIFYEFIFGTGDFASQWHGSGQPFVYSNGDTTGYGLHGDFVCTRSINLKFWIANDFPLLVEWVG